MMSAHDMYPTNESSSTGPEIDAAYRYYQNNKDGLHDTPTISISPDNGGVVRALQLHLQHYPVFLEITHESLPDTPQELRMRLEDRANGYAEGILQRLLADFSVDSGALFKAFEYVEGADFHQEAFEVAAACVDMLTENPYKIFDLPEIRERLFG